MSSKIEKNIVEQIGLYSKITSFISTKKGLYLIGAILLVAAIYYYTIFGKDSKNLSTQNVGGIPQPPPGYVTVPIEMFESLQRGPQYQEMVQPQQQMELHPQQQQMEMQPQKTVPKLKHNKQLDEDEDEEIAEQNLSKDEMDNIQEQLDAMQQQRGNSNNV